MRAASSEEDISIRETTNRTLWPLTVPVPTERVTLTHGMLRKVSLTLPRECAAQSVTVSLRRTWKPAGAAWPAPALEPAEALPWPAPDPPPPVNAHTSRAMTATTPATMAQLGTGSPRRWGAAGPAGAGVTAGLSNAVVCAAPAAVGRGTCAVAS